MAVDINLGTSFPPTRGTHDYNKPDPTLLFLLTIYSYA
jgi:hypothetical protein